MAVSKRLRWGSTGLILAFSVVLACTGNSGGEGDDDDMSMPDADTIDECSLSCTPPDQCCDLAAGTFCIKTSTDKLNCGSCGNACSPQVADSCGGSQCKCGFGPECTEGKTCLGGPVGCRDLQTDTQNCGTPGHACGAEETCTNGMCSCGGAACEVGSTCCNGACTDTKTDEANCGVCDTVCMGGMTECKNSACGCTGVGPTCPVDTWNVRGECCGAGCTNICTDVAHCGACGHACAAGDTCNFGSCSSGPANPDVFFCSLTP